MYTRTHLHIFISTCICTVTLLIHTTLHTLAYMCTTMWVWIYANGQPWVHARMHTHIHSLSWVATYTCCTHIPVGTHTRKHTHNTSYICLHENLYIHMFISTCSWVHTGVLMCLCWLIRAYIHTYIHTYIYTCKNIFENSQIHTCMRSYYYVRIYANTPARRCLLIWDYQ